MRVLIVGVSTRAAADSAARAGFDVTALDAYADLDQHPSVRALSLSRDFGTTFSAEALVNAAGDLPSDAVVYLSNLENHPKAVDALAATRTLWGNGSDVLRQVRNPRTLADVLTKRGVRAPRVVMPDQLPSMPRDATRWMLKPRASGGGHGVRLWHAGEAVTPGHYLQEFVRGASGSVVFVAARGRGVVLGLTRQLVGDSAFGVAGFRYCGNILADDSNQVRHATALVDALVSQFALVGVGSIDVVSSEDGLRPVEVNPRWSASMELVERARDVSMFALHADACVRGELPTFDISAPARQRETHGKAVVFARRDVIARNTRDWMGDAGVRDVPHEGERIAAGQPICTVLATGSDESDCYAKLVERAARVYRSFT